MLSSSTLRLIFCLLFMTFTSVNAEVYRWQDEEGKWHFGDTPVDKQGNPVYEEVEESATPTKKPSKNKLTEQPNKPPINKSASDLSKESDQAVTLDSPPDSENALSEVTHAVVTIKTAMGNGSGFFITDTGFLITNKHVVRPASTRSVGELEKILKEKTASLRNIERAMKTEKASLRDRKETIKDLKKMARSLDGLQKKMALQRIENLTEQYENRIKAYEEFKKQFRKIKNEHDKAASDFRLSSAISSTAQQFKLIMKNKEEHRAKLVSLSKEYDLALLKLENGLSKFENEKAPYLALAKSVNVFQGLPVYAIGSPLGLRDSMTSGIISRLDDNYLVTDVQILPGNSGGPLVSAEGVVLGVNTLKLGKTALSEGFGFSIPINRVLEEFAEELSGSDLLFK